jgi:hypothetical protein
VTRASLAAQKSHSTKKSSNVRGLCRITDASLSNARNQVLGQPATRSFVARFQGNKLPLVHKQLHVHLIGKPRVMGDHHNRDSGGLIELAQKRMYLSTR